MAKNDGDRAKSSAQGNAAKTEAATSSFTSGLGSDYSDINKTGGFTPGEEADFVNSATSGVGNTYNVLSRQLQQEKARTGGLGGGGETAQMARHMAQDQATAGTNARVGLNQVKTGNRLAGLSAYGQQLLQALGLNVQSQGQETSALTQLAMRPSGFNGFMSGLGSLAGGVGGLLGGVAGIK